jgi:hypothetical protein
MPSTSFRDVLYAEEDRASKLGDELPTVGRRGRPTIEQADSRMSYRYGEKSPSMGKRIRPRSGSSTRGRVRWCTRFSPPRPGSWPRVSLRRWRGSTPSPSHSAFPLFCKARRWFTIQGSQRAQKGMNHMYTRIGQGCNGEAELAGRKIRFPRRGARTTLRGFEMEKNVRVPGPRVIGAPR